MDQTDKAHDPDVPDVAQTLHNTALVLNGVTATLTDVSELARRVQRTSTLNALLAALTIIVVLLMSIFIIEVHRDINTNQRVIDAVKECTTPGFECYDANQRRSSERLAPIIAMICEAVPLERRKPPCALPPR